MASSVSSSVQPGIRRRSRSGSAGEMLLNAAEAVEERLERTYLLLFSELPAWRRDNPSILSGYRPESNSFAKSLASIFAVHNESVNIWTHLAGSLAFLTGGCSLLWENVVSPRYATANDSDRLVFVCFFGGAVACMGMSATYHALTNHSEHIAKWGNKLDYSGIVVLIVGSYVPALYYGLFCHPNLTVVYMYLQICILGLACLAVSWLEHFRKPAFRAFRAAMFVGLGVSGVVPIAHGVAMYGYAGMDAKMGLGWVTLQGALYITGAAIYAMRWPEKAFPGRFDIWGSSHQIFHCFVVAAAITHLMGMRKAFDYHHLVMGSECPAGS